MHHRERRNVNETLLYGFAMVLATGLVAAQSADQKSTTKVMVDEREVDYGDGVCRARRRRTIR